MKCERSRNWAQHRYKMIHPLWSFNICFLSCQNFERNMLPYSYYVPCNNWCVSVAQSQHFYTPWSSSKSIHLKTRWDICILLCKHLIWWCLIHAHITERALGLCSSGAGCHAARQTCAIVHSITTQKMST